MAGSKPCRHIVTLFITSCLLSVGHAKSHHITLNGTSGWFTSPNYPQDYPDNSDIIWTIKAPQGHVVQLIIDDFNLTDQPLCNDYFKVIDGSVDVAKNVIYYRCGSNATWQNYIESRIHIMTVVFFSDGSNTAKGFNATFNHTPYEEEFMLAADHTDENILGLNILRQASGPIFNQSRLVGELEFDPEEEHVYFTDQENQNLWRVKIDGSGEELLIDGLHTASGLTLNPRSRNLYFISEDSNIIVSGMEGELRYQIGTGTARTKDLATDYISSYIFWAAGRSIEAKIMRADGDGGNAKDFMTGNIGDPRGLTVDYCTDGSIVLYVCDNQFSRILSINTDGTSQKEVIAPPEAIRNPFDVAVDSNGNIYWTETGSYGVEVLDEDGNYHEDVFIGHKKRNLTALTIYSSAVRTPDQCEDGCSPGELCLPVPFTQQTCIQVLPTIYNCPSDINQTTDAPPTPVTWDEPDAVWPRTTAHHVWRSNKPGSQFDVGTTEVTYIFTDGLDNRADCTFNVTVTKTSEKNDGIPLVSIIIPVGALILLVLIAITGIVLYKRCKRNDEGHYQRHITTN